MLVLLDDPFSLAGTGELVLERLKTLAESQNPIAILAPKLLARMKKLEAAAEESICRRLQRKKPARGNGGLVNALAARRSRAGRVTEGGRLGDAPEMHGLLHWKARDLMQKGGGSGVQKERASFRSRLSNYYPDSRSGDLPLSLRLSDCSILYKGWAGRHYSCRRPFLIGPYCWALCFGALAPGSTFDRHVCVRARWMSPSALNSTSAYLGRNVHTSRSYSAVDIRPTATEIHVRCLSFGTSWLRS